MDLNPLPVARDVVERHEGDVSNILRQLSASGAEKEAAAAEVLLRVSQESWRLERWLALATAFIGIATTIALMTAVAGDVPQLRNIVAFASARQLYLQGAVLAIAFGWLIYAWHSYRQMMRARSLILKSELIELWLMSRRSGKG